MKILSLLTETVQIGDREFTMKEMTAEEVERFMRSTEGARKLLSEAENGIPPTEETSKAARRSNLEFWRTILRDQSLTEEWISANTNDRFARELSDVQYKLNEFETSLGNLKCAMVISAAAATAQQLGPILSALSQKPTT